MYNPEFETWYNERFNYTPQPPPETKAKIYAGWCEGLKKGLQVGDAHGTLEFLAKSMKSKLIPFRPLSVDEMVLHRFVKNYGLSSPVEFLV